jgi:hypothetical protein
MQMLGVYWMWSYDLLSSDNIFSELMGYEDQDMKSQWLRSGFEERVIDVSHFFE